MSEEKLAREIGNLAAEHGAKLLPLNVSPGKAEFLQIMAADLAQCLDAPIAFVGVREIDGAWTPVVTSRGSHGLAVLALALLMQAADEIKATKCSCAVCNATGPAIEDARRALGVLIDPRYAGRKAGLA